MNNLSRTAGLALMLLGGTTMSHASTAVEMKDFYGKWVNIKSSNHYLVVEKDFRSIENGGSKTKSELIKLITGMAVIKLQYSPGAYGLFVIKLQEGGSTTGKRTMLWRYCDGTDGMNSELYKKYSADELWNVLVKNQALVEQSGKRNFCNLKDLNADGWKKATLVFDSSANSVSMNGIEGDIYKLKNADPSTRKAAAEALGDSNDPQAVEPLVKALGDDSRDVKIQVVISLGRLGDKRAVEPLLKALGDEDDSVKILAIRSLGYIGDKQAVEPLIGMLDSGDKVSIIQQIVYSLGLLRDKRAVGPLVGLMNRSTSLLDDKHITRSFTYLKAVATALAKIGDKSVVPEIKNAIDRANKVAANSSKTKIRMGIMLIVRHLRRAITRLEK